MRRRRVSPQPSVRRDGFLMATRSSIRSSPPACATGAEPNGHHCYGISEEASELSNKHGFVLFRAWSELFQGCALAALGRAEEGLPLLHRGVALTRAIDQGLHLPQTLTMLAYAYG